MQEFVLRGGTPVWHTAHFDITADGLERAVGGRAPAPDQR